MNAALPGRGCALLAGGGITEGQRLWLLDGERPAEAILVPVNSEGRLEVTEDEGGESSLSMVYYALTDGRLRLVTLFLVDRWAGAEVGWEGKSLTLRVAQGEQYIVLPLPER